MKVLFFTTHHLESPYQVGSHRYATFFCEMGYDLLYISAPVTPFHLLKIRDKDVRKRMGVVAGKTKAFSAGKIREYIPFSLIAPDSRPLLRSSWVMEHWPVFTFPHLLRFIKRAGFQNPDLVFIDNIYFGPVFSQIEAKQSIFRVMDYHPGFPGWNPNSIEAIAKKISQQADLLVYSSQSILPYIQELAPKEHFYVGNGIEMSRYKLAEAGIPAELVDLKGPVITYVGSMDNWFDVDLVKALALSMPSYHFVLIGPPKARTSVLRTLANVHLLGSRRQEELPAYLHASHVGIIPFDTQAYPDLIDHVNPLKLYEYLACGLPVVASKWQALEALNSPAILCENVSEFQAAIQNAVNHPPDKADLQHFAQQYDWKKMLQPLQKYLHKKKRSHC